MNTNSRTALAMAIGVALATSHGHAATFNVTNTNDSGPGSLRQAIEDAGSNSESDTISLSGVSGATIMLSSGELAISDDFITIEGAAATVDANRNSRVFRVTNASFVASDLTVTGGFASDDSGIGGDSGGGIYAAGSDLVLTNLRVVNNESLGGGGGVATESNLLIGLSGGLQINDSIISGNTAGESGGGIRAYLYESVSIANSMITGNRTTDSMGREAANESGPRSDLIERFSPILHSRGSFTRAAAGALIQAGGDIELVNSTVSGNTALSDIGIVGGAELTSFNGSVLIEGSTISNNTAAVFGGITALSPMEVTLRNSTISGNSTTDMVAGGAFSAGAEDVVNPILAIEFSTIAENSAGGSVGGVALMLDSTPALISGSVISGNAAALDPDLAISTEPLTQVDMQWSLVGVDPSTGILNKDPASQSLAGLDPRLGPLSDNGGPTQTMLPSDDSPLLNVIPPGNIDCGVAISVDQRGQLRPFSTGCDVGAIETEVEGSPVPLPESVAVPVLDRIGLLIMAGVLSIVGLLGMRRRSKII